MLAGLSVLPGTWAVDDPHDKSTSGGIVTTEDGRFSIVSKAMKQRRPSGEMRYPEFRWNMNYCLPGTIWVAGWDQLRLHEFPWEGPDGEAYFRPEFPPLGWCGLPDAELWTLLYGSAGPRFMVDGQPWRLECNWSDKGHALRIWLVHPAMGVTTLEHTADAILAMQNLRVMAARLGVNEGWW